MGKIMSGKEMMVMVFCCVFFFVLSLSYCPVAFSQEEPEEEEPVQALENPLLKKGEGQAAAMPGQPNQDVLVNDGEGPGGDRPSPAFQQIHPSAPAQTMRPSAPAQTMRPSAPAQTMRPSAPTEEPAP